MIRSRKTLRGIGIFVIALLLGLGVIAAMKWFTNYHGG
jgi:hypothetical protein